MTPSVSSFSIIRLTDELNSKGRLGSALIHLLDKKMDMMIKDFSFIGLTA